VIELPVVANAISLHCKCRDQTESLPEIAESGGEKKYSPPRETTKSRKLESVSAKESGIQLASCELGGLGGICGVEPGDVALGTRQCPNDGVRTLAMGEAVRMRARLLLLVNDRQ
jgi:hypothetical protein